MAFLRRSSEILFAKLMGRETPPCKNAPADMTQRQTGKCHVCESEASVGFCGVCCHWFCRDCSDRITDRAWAALLEQVQGRSLGCCGPAIDATSPAPLNPTETAA